MKNLRTYKPLIAGMMCLSILATSCGSNGYAIGKNNRNNFALSNVVTPLNQVPAKASTIKIALLLDTSGSMDGLLEQTKSQLWDIVNTLAYAKKDNVNANVQFALYQYGNDGVDSKTGYIEKVLPLSNDLDELSEKLFSLSTNGGSEYCGQAIETATNQLEWNNDSKDLNLIFIAGNEPFTQGRVSYNKACKNALLKGITINTIYCGNYDEGVNTQWQKGAFLAEGKYMNIDMNQKTIYVETPYDQKIADLNADLNKTYITYGNKGASKLANQSTQDYNSFSYGRENMVNRAVSKSNHLYLNTSWDLVDASTQENFKIEKVNKLTLPKEMQNMTTEEQKTYIAKKSVERKVIQNRINALNQQRQAYLNDNSSGNTTSLNNAIVKAIKEQAITKGFTFDNMNENLEYPLADVDFDYFETVTAEAKAHLSTRLLDFATFLAYSKEKNTIILDTRSKMRYDKLHIKGAIHINFSDFTQDYLNAMIPDKNTRILIYCNNNFKQDAPLIRQNFATKSVPIIDFTTISSSINAVDSKVKTLALNIPTYINLFGYGFKNVYELHELVNMTTLGLVLEGTDALSLYKEF